MKTFYLVCILLLSGCVLNCAGLPLEANNLPSVDADPTLSPEKDEPKEHRSSGCELEQLDLKDVKFLEKGSVLVVAYNESMPPTETHIVHNNIPICFERSTELKKQIFDSCIKWLYDVDEFTALTNGSVLLGDKLIEPGTYEFLKGKLLRCANAEEDYDENTNSNSELPVHISTGESPTITMGKVGSSISIIALTAHLITFCLVPSLRNLPGYNLASLSVALLIGYSFVIIGQIPEVLGMFCVISGVLQQNFFLAAFFCMNVMAFDVWRTLKMATTKLVVDSPNKKKSQFIMYTIYSWGAPLMITVTSVVLDNTESVPLWIKPQFGKKDTCWMTNATAKAYFFSVPAFVLFVVNGVLFVLSALIIRNNTMKSVSDQQKQTARLNLVLYVRLALMMGVTWLISVAATLTNSREVWFLFDLLNPLQGLFVFLLFTCSRKVYNHIRQKVSFRSKVSTSDKQTTCSSSDKRASCATTHDRQSTFYEPDTLTQHSHIIKSTPS
ncbi:g-protein coupled receptor Mth2 [Caerostris darwini]|uniref:G-protein coupled receptor Mth2 n=1 Tax=Caerostris darwini TaxID=1538125 RepID=A0AAV4MTC8_9ARAC|nr:g-protein coupled receptor Mth2 [Caerostris darwini]